VTRHADLAEPETKRTARVNMTPLPRAFRWSKRNALILLPTAIFATYVGWYVLAFPALYSRGKLPSGNPLKLQKLRLCSAPWQKAVWKPLALLESSIVLHGDGYDFFRFDATDPLNPVHRYLIHGWKESPDEAQ
jgi:hypothetical protein